jgi:hypothetical protein
MMIGKRVMCRISSAYQDKTVTGILVRQCDNTNVYVLRLDHGVDFVNSKTYTYLSGSTILVTDSEIVR